MTKGARPEQAVLSRDTDISKTEETRRVIEARVNTFPETQKALKSVFFLHSEGGVGVKTSRSIR